MQSLAIVVLTRFGLEKAIELKTQLGPDALIYAPACVTGRCQTKRTEILFDADAPGVIGWKGPLRLVFPIIWSRHGSIVAIMSLGIVVRLIGPLTMDKAATRPSSWSTKRAGSP